MLIVELEPKVAFTSSQRARLQPIAERLEVEDVTRLAELRTESSRRLLTATKGAVEQSLADWKADLAEVAKQSTGGASPAGVKEGLSRALSNLIGNEPRTPPKLQPVWEAAVKAEVSPEQRVKWKEELNRRQRFQSESHGRVCFFGVRPKRSHLAGSMGKARADRLKL